MIKLTTQIKDNSVNDAICTDTLSNSLESEYSPSIISATDFNVDYVEKKRWKLDSTSGPAFTKNLIDLIDGVDLTKLTVIHIQATTYNVNPTVTKLGRRFTVNLAGSDICTTSQFTLGNISSILAGDFIVKNIEAQTDEEVILNIWLGFKE